MARRIVSRGRFPMGKSRSVLWSGQSVVGTLIFGNTTLTAAGVGILPVGFAALEKFTVTRELVDLTVGFTAAEASGNVAEAYLGIINVSAEAFGVGATAMPDPRTRQSDDWLYLGMFFIRAVSTGTAVPVSEVSFVRRSLDLRGQRKLVPGEATVGVIALDGLTGASRTVQFSMSYRELVKLA